jgi:hypothetical protein
MKLLLPIAMFSASACSGPTAPFEDTSEAPAETLVEHDTDVTDDTDSDRTPAPSTPCPIAGIRSRCFDALTAAFEAVEPGDVIDLAAGVHRGEFIVPPLTELTIRGAGASTIVEPSRSGAPVFTVNPTGALTLETLDVTGAHDASALTASGEGARLTLRAVTVRDNVAPIGAGVFADEGASVMILQSRLERNRATSEGGGLALLGGATAVLVDCVLTGNTASGGGGGAWLHARGEQATLLTSHRSDWGTGPTDNTPQDAYLVHEAGTVEQIAVESLDASRFTCGARSQRCL